MEDKSKDIQIQTLSNFTIIEELQNRLKISGVMLAEGIWNGVLYSKDQIKQMFDVFKGKLKHLNYKVEHERTPEFKNLDVGINTEVEWSDILGAILYKAEITHPKVIEDIKAGKYKGTSMKIALKRTMDEKGNIKGINLEPIDNSVTSDPACDPSRIIFSREELNSEGVNSIQTFSVIKEEELNKMSEEKNTKVELNEQELEHITELVNEAIKRKRITYEYVIPKTDNPVVEQPKQPELSLSDDFTYQAYNDKFIVVRQFNTELDAKSFVDSIKGKTIFLSKEDKDEFPVIDEQEYNISELNINEEELVWEETDQYIRSGHGPEGDPKSYRTVMVDKSKGIKGIVGCPEGHYENGKCDTGMVMKSFLFPKSKFTKEEAQSWFKSHKMSKETLSVKTESTPVIEETKAVENLSTEPAKVEPVKVEQVPVAPVEQPKVEVKATPVETPKEVPKEEPKVEVVKEVPKVEEPKVEPIKEAPKETVVVVEPPKVVETPKVVEAPKVEVKETPKEVPKVEEVKPIETPKKEVIKEEPKPLTKSEIIKEIVSNPDLLADILIGSKKGK